MKYRVSIKRDGRQAHLRITEGDLHCGTITVTDGPHVEELARAILQTGQMPRRYADNGEQGV